MRLERVENPLFGIVAKTIQAIPLLTNGSLDFLKRKLEVEMP